MRTVPLQLTASSGKGASIPYVCVDQLMRACCLLMDSICIVCGFVFGVGGPCWLWFIYNGPQSFGT